MLGRLPSRFVQRCRTQIRSAGAAVISRPVVLSRSSHLSSLSSASLTLSRGSARWFSASDSTTVCVPNLGDSISEGTLVQWAKSVGEAVAMDDVVALIETDKITLDVRAPTAGVVTSQLVETGETVKVGGELFALSASAKASAAPAKPAPAAKSAPAASTPTPAPAAAAPKPVAAPSKSQASHDHARKPLIQFRYGAANSSSKQSAAALNTKNAEAEASGYFGVSLAQSPLPEYPEDIQARRPTFSAYEMQLIQMGGAEPY